MIANRYFFKLFVDYKQEKIFLFIWNKNMILLENSTYWSFKDLKERLEKKLKYLAFIKAWPKTVNNIQYYKYYNISFYRLKDFEHFLKAIDLGIIQVTFKIGVFRSGQRLGEIHDRGTGFEIEESNIGNLFDLLII